MYKVEDEKEDIVLMMRELKKMETTLLGRYIDAKPGPKKVLFNEMFMHCGATMTIGDKLLKE